jgi:hypothetical protein
MPSYLLPGLTAGIFARAGGRSSSGKRLKFISTQLTNGLPKSGFDLLLRSSIMPTIRAANKERENFVNSYGCKPELASLST